MSEKTKLLDWQIIENEDPMVPPEQMLVAVNGKQLAKPMSVEAFREAAAKAGALLVTFLEGSKVHYQEYIAAREYEGEDFVTLANGMMDDTINRFVKDENVVVTIVTERGVQSVGSDVSGDTKTAPAPTKSKTTKKKTPARKKVKKPVKPKLLRAKTPKLGRNDFLRGLMIRRMEDEILQLWDNAGNSFAERENLQINTQLLWDAADGDTKIPPLDPLWKKYLINELRSEGWITVKTEGKRTFMRPRLNHPVWARRREDDFWYEDYGV